MDVIVDSLVEGARRSKGLIVVIDVLRAFTTASVVFQRGADHIIMVADVEEALTLREQKRVDLCIGEVDGFKPEGFDFGNSPFELSQIDLSGLVIAQSTRAGTTGITMAASNEYTRLFAGALVNAAATAKVVAESHAELVTLVAMGAWGTTRSDEDEQCALYMKNLIQGRFPDREAVRNLVLSGEESQKYHDPVQIQYHPEDLELASRPDSVDFAIELKRQDEFLVARPVYAEVDC